MPSVVTLSADCRGFTCLQRRRPNAPASAPPGQADVEQTPVETIGGRHFLRGVNPINGISRLKVYPFPALMHSETASCQCESLKMATFMRATALAAMAAAAPLF